jgi:V/A-type H+-transporting ATPase subunit D
VSRSAWLELREELTLVNDGYRFLDEKRIMLAAEMLRQREAYRQARDELAKLCDSARRALVDAAADLGLDGLQVYPAAELDAARVDIAERPSVGLRMLEAELVTGEIPAGPEPVLPSPAARACAAKHREVLAAGARLAALAANLQRLIHEYRRTERRVRALENVVLPEIREDLAMMEEHLDLIEQEEVIRVRTVRGTPW